MSSSICRTVPTTRKRIKQMAPTLEPAFFREVLGQYPTGVVVVTAMSPSGEPLGMTVGTFTSVSLDPPLVAFMPSKSSSSWRALQESGKRYCINVLSADQQRIGRDIAVRKSDKFTGIEWRPSRHGNPLIVGAVAHIDCDAETVHDAGDHYIVIARVSDLDIHNTEYPLVFFRGGYGSFTPQPAAGS
ncbi:flavin reductase family protein [Mycolicibacterium goodii]